MRGWGTTRRALFDQFDRQALSKLPTAAYEYADWRRCRVGLDYHIEVDRGFYSVPHQLLRQEVEVRLTVGTVEVFHRGKRVASHVRGAARHRPSTVIEHMPSAHRHDRDWTHDRIRYEAARVGDDTATLADLILRSRPHPEQGFRACIGILSLASRYGAERVDAACARALALGTRSYTSVATILKNRQDQVTKPADPPGLHHENIRGLAIITEESTMLIHPTASACAASAYLPWRTPLSNFRAWPTPPISPGGLARLPVDREAKSRDNKRLSRRLRDAKLRQAAVV